MILSVGAAVVFTLVWLAVLPDLRHPKSWLNERLAALGVRATTGAVIAFGVVLLMLSPVGRAIGLGALQKLRLVVMALGLGASVMALAAMQVVRQMLERARRQSPPPAPSLTD